MIEVVQRQLFAGLLCFGSLLVIVLFLVLSRDPTDRTTAEIEESHGSFLASADDRFPADSLDVRFVTSDKLPKQASSPTSFHGYQPLAVRNKSLTKNDVDVSGDAISDNQTSNILRAEEQEEMEFQFLSEDLHDIPTKDTSISEEKRFGERWRMQRKKSLTVIGMGVGTTATRGLYRDLCRLGVRTIHWKLHCNLPETGEDVDGGKEARRKIFALSRTMSRGFEETKPGSATTTECPACAQRISIFLPKYIAELAAAPSIEAFLDTPYPEISGELIPELLREKRREHVKLILTQREAAAWVKRRLELHPTSPECCQLPQKLTNDVSPWSLIQCARKGRPICSQGALSEQALKQTYIDHNNWVVEYATSKGLDLLVVNYFDESISENERLERIAKFLSIPPSPYDDDEH